MEPRGDARARCVRGRGGMGCVGTTKLTPEARRWDPFLFVSGFPAALPWTLCLTVVSLYGQIGRERECVNDLVWDRCTAYGWPC